MSCKVNDRHSWITVKKYFCHIFTDWLCWKRGYMRLIMVADVCGVQDSVSRIRLHPAISGLAPTSASPHISRFSWKPWCWCWIFTQSWTLLISRLCHADEAWKGGNSCPCLPDTCPGLHAYSDGPRGGTAIYGLYSYVPLWRVWFSSSLL